MKTFEFSLPTRVVFGAGTVETMGAEAAHLGRHALVVTGADFARRSGLVDHIVSLLTSSGVTSTVYDGIGPNPPVEAIDSGARLAREAEADLVIGLGGGSVLDAAKGIAVAATSGRTIWDFVRHDANHDPEPIDRALPLLQAPIVASTGSETNDVAVVFDPVSRTKAPVRSPHFIARVAVVDPSLTFTVPAEYTTVGAMNIVSQLMELYLTSDEFSVTDRVTEGLIRVVMDSLPRAMRRQEDLDARSSLSWAAVLASTVASAGRTGSAPVVAMALPLGAMFNVQHGRAVSALWPSYMRYALNNRVRLPQIGRFKRYALLGRQIFGIHETDDEVAAETTAHRFVTWLRGMGMPTNLCELGLGAIDLTEVGCLADQAVLISGHGRRLPGGLTRQDVEHVYDGALHAA